MTYNDNPKSNTQKKTKAEIIENNSNSFQMEAQNIPEGYKLPQENQIFSHPCTAHQLKSEGARWSFFKFSPELSSVSCKLR